MIDASTKEEQAQLWMVRKSALPILFTLETEGEITPFIEDVSVSVKNLGTYLEELHTIFERKGIESAVYGHAGRRKSSYQTYSEPENRERSGP